MVSRRYLIENSVTIIVPAWNESKVISKTCEFLRKLKLPFQYSELIFIAGGNDNTFELCKEAKLENFKKVIVLRQFPKDYKSGALIKGINKSKGDFITIIDADTFVSSNLIMQIVNSLKKFDVVNCNYLPLIRKGFWHDYYIMRKLIWSKNPQDLPSLFGASTISLKRKIVDRIGTENFFTKKSTAGIDYYMGLVLKKNKINIGYVEDVKVITPRPASLFEFIKDQSRWSTAFFKLHQNEKKLIFVTLVLSLLSFIFPLFIFLLNFNKIRKTKTGMKKKIEFFFILFFVEYLLSIMRVRAIIRTLVKRLKFLGHFTGIRYKIR